MNLLHRILLGILLLMSIVNRALPQEIWMGTGASFDIAKDMSMKFKMQSRFVQEDNFKHGGNMSQIALKYDITKRVGIGATYRYFSSRAILGESTSDSDDKQRFTMDILLESKKNDNDGRFKDRFRIQHSFKEDGDHDVRLRNRLAYEMKFRKGISFKVSDEIFMEAEEFEFELNRISFELESRISPRIDLDTFFHYEKKLEGNRKSNYIVGAMLFFRL
jgi:hypothetical protein